MIITNRASYIKNYKILRIDRSIKLILCKDILAIRFGTSCVIYNTGKLKGVIVHNSIICTAAGWDDIGYHTLWNSNYICGLWAPGNNVPIYNPEPSSVSFYGYKTLQYRLHRSRYNSLNTNLSENIMQI